MSDRATEFLNEWTLTRDTSPISHHDAVGLADRWEAEALENGITPEELRTAAKGDVADYLVRTFGAA